MKALFSIGAVAAALVVVASAGSVVKPRFSLTLGVIGPGTVVASPGTRCSGYLTRPHVCKVQLYSAGTKVKLTAVPKAGAKLSLWKGSVIGKALTRSITMSAAKSVSAVFVRVPRREPPPPPPPPPLGAKNNPLPLGHTMALRFGSGETWDAKVIGYTPDATSQVLAVPRPGGGSINRPPQAGYQYVIVAYTFTLTAGAASVDRWDIADHLFRYFKVVGPSGVARGWQDTHAPTIPPMPIASG